MRWAIFILLPAAGLVAAGVALDARPRADLPEAWQQIRSQMSREELARLAGEPGSKSADGWHDTWFVHGKGNLAWKLRVDYDTAGRVLRAVAEQYDKYSGRSYYFRELVGP
jgi:hypothetical protein